MSNARMKTACLHFSNYLPLSHIFNCCSCWKTWSSWNFHVSCLFSDLAALTAKSENKKGFLTSEKARITLLPGWHEADLSLPGE